MKIFLELRHPAHVHQFKYFIWEMLNRGHEIKVGAMDKEITTQLLNNLEIDYTLIGTNKKGLLKKGLDVLKIDKKVYDLAKEFDPDLFVGRASPSLAHVSTVLRKPYISFSDSELNFFLWLTYLPFANTILTPRNFKRDFGKKHIRLDSFKELSYLHPNHFKPDPRVRDLLGVKPNEKFVILRFVAFQAYHDVGISGFTPESKVQLLDELSKYAKVFITSEAPLSADLKKHELAIPKEMLHSALHYASLYVGDSQTTATEAACLGTPVIRCNAFARTKKERSNFIELEEQYQLMHNYSVQEQDRAIQKAVELIQQDNFKDEWIKRRDAMLRDKIDLTKYMVWFTENYPKSLEKKYAEQKLSKAV